VQLTNKQLKQIIKEELDTHLKEVYGAAGMRRGARGDREWRSQAAINPDRAAMSRRIREKSLSRDIDKMFRDLAFLGIELADPTPVHGIIDASGAYMKYYDNPTLENGFIFLLELVAVLPMLGNAARTTKAIRKIKYISDKALDVKDSLEVAGI
jgi:hypothetical protein|tara:strand:- start:291 stop:752 length:462 start_codon:yes stop_codon:yes gene_type:complete